MLDQFVQSLSLLTRVSADSLLAGSGSPSVAARRLPNGEHLSQKEPWRVTAYRTRSLYQKQPL